MSTPIEHVIVLMLENRSFDSVLGFQRPKSATFEGLDGTETNPLEDGTSVGVSKLSGNDGYVTDPDPHHEHPDAMAHLFGGQVDDGAPKNQGFALRYRQTAKGAPLSPQVVKKVMASFDVSTQLPAVNALAEHFVVCDHWFSSLPGPTWPNRFFSHCASSGGHFESPSDATSVWSDLGSVFNMPTIFENLGAARKSWNVYYHDVPQSLALQRLHHYRGNFKHFHAFLNDCTSGTLPNYSFVEPAFFDSALLRMTANDMHPPHDVRYGDALVAAVYNAVRANETLWAKSLLLVVWDEHGGFFDHVAPPSAVIPDDASKNASFRFDRLGVRVPAILVSPWVGKGAVDSTVYDHSSIPATLKRLFAIPAFLTKRDAAASTFEHNLQSIPRTDTPKTITGADTSTLPASAPVAAADLPDHQKNLLELVSRFCVAGLASPPPDSAEAAILHVARYLDV